MKKTLNQTIIVFLVLSLLTTTQALAQDVIEEENQEVIETQSKEADVEQREAEIAAKAAERKAKIAKEQMKAAEKQMIISRDQVDMLKDKLEDLRLPRLPKLPFSQLQHSGSGGILVIPTDQMKLEDLTEITEDMNVMSRIFYRKLNQSNVTTARGRLLGELNPYFGRDNNMQKAIYLEGYGTLFFLRVNMQLSAPPEEKEQETPQKETDPVWSKVRQEMYEPEKAAKSRTDGRPEEKFDAEKVESLKTNLIKTLKHATNIRGLQPEQLVIITVIGETNQPATNIAQTFRYGRSTGSRIVRTLPEVEKDSLQPSVLTICAKKSDIDAFAKGQIDYDQFRKRIEMFKSYANAGQKSSPGVEIHQVAQEVSPVRQVGR